MEYQPLIGTALAPAVVILLKPAQFLGVCAETLRQTGSYNLIFQVLAVAVVVLGIACWFVTVPEREVRTQRAPLCDPISEPSA